MARASGLGRGLSSLIPIEAHATAQGGLRDVPLSEIRPNKFQPRKEFDEESLASLVDSICALGVLQPVLLRETPEGELELIAGERRCRAARRAGLQSIPALVQRASDEASLERALVENLHRSDLNPLEEAGAYRQLIEDFHLTHDEVARRVGKSRAAVSNALRLFQLPPAVQRLVREGRLSFGHARALLGTPDRELQERLANEAVELGQSVRVLEEIIRVVLRPPELLAPTPVSALGPVDRADGDDGEIRIEAGIGNGIEMSSEAGIGTGIEMPSEVGIGTGIDGSSSTDAALLPLVDSRGPGGATQNSQDQRDQRAGSGGEARRPAVSGLRPPGFLELEELLGNHLDTRVSVEMGSRHGRVVVEFATLEDLERIYRAMLGER